MVLPNIRAGVVTGALLCFASALGEFAIVNVLASSITTVSVWGAGAIRESSTEAGGTSELAVVTTVTFALLFVVSAAAVYGNRSRSNRLAPGQGYLPWRDMVETLKALDYDGWLSMEHSQLPDSPTAARQGHNFMRALLDD